jgi:hypothetical protein
MSESRIKGLHGVCILNHRLKDYTECLNHGFSKITQVARIITIFTYWCQYIP